MICGLGWTANARESFSAPNAVESQSSMGALSSLERKIDLNKGMITLNSISTISFRTLLPMRVQILLPSQFGRSFQRHLARVTVMTTHSYCGLQRTGAVFRTVKPSKQLHKTIPLPVLREVRQRTHEVIRKARIHRLCSACLSSSERRTKHPIQDSPQEVDSILRCFSSFVSH
jgi:hypothetical protein